MVHAKQESRSQMPSASRQTRLPSTSVRTHLPHTPAALMFAYYGPEDSSHLVVLAPGDECKLTDTTPVAVATALAEAGVRVVCFGFPPCDDADADVRDALLAEHIRQAAVARNEGVRLVLGGLSRGARVSVSLLSELGAEGLLCFSYPFHGRQDPDPRGRVKKLASIAVPALICQGTRDSRGNRQQVRGYRLPEHIQVHWHEDANHALRPRPSSGYDQATQLAEAAAISARFVTSLGAAQ